MTIEWKPDCAAEQIQGLEHLLACVSEIDGKTTADAAVGIILCHERGAGLTGYVSRGRWWFMWTPEDYAEHGLGSYHSTSSADLISPPSQTDLLACYLIVHHGEVDLREASDTLGQSCALPVLFLTKATRCIEVDFRLTSSVPHEHRCRQRFVRPPYGHQGFPVAIA